MKSKILLMIALAVLAFSQESKTAYTATCPDAAIASIVQVAFNCGRAATLRDLAPKEAATIDAKFKDITEACAALEKYAK